MEGEQRLSLGSTLAVRAGKSRPVLCAGLMENGSLSLRVSTRTSPWTWPCWCCETSLPTSAGPLPALPGASRPESVLTTTAVRTEPSLKPALSFAVKGCFLCHAGLLAVSPSGKYGGGIHPNRWNGSPAILQKYFRTRAPIK